MPRLKNCVWTRGAQILAMPGSKYLNKPHIVNPSAQQMSVSPFSVFFEQGFRAIKVQDLINGFSSQLAVF